MPRMARVVHYIELNPVRARMVAAAGKYPRSSYRQRTGETACWIDLGPAYMTWLTKRPSVP